MRVTFDVANLHLHAGTNDITVIAKAGGYNNSSPSNAIEFAVESPIGTWLFNEDLTHNPMVSWAVNFTTRANSDSSTSTQNMVEIYFEESGNNAPGGRMYYRSSNGTVNYIHTLGISSWSWPGYRTITITGGADATNSKFILWLKANATKVS